MPVSRSVWRYELPGPDVFVSAPDGAIPLHVDFQVRAPHSLCVWMSVDPDEDMALCHFVTTATGAAHPPPEDGYRHLATVQEPHTGLVWHVWTDLPGDCGEDCQ